MSEESKGLVNVSDKDIEDYNSKGFDKVDQSLIDSKMLFGAVTEKANTNYNITVGLYIATFIFGLILLSIPIKTAYFGGTGTLTDLIGGSVGIVTLITVLLFRPAEKIHELMADFSQRSIIITSYQQQVQLRLMELDIRDRSSWGKAAEHINTAASGSVELIQKYCEAKEPTVQVAEQTEPAQSEPAQNPPAEPEKNQLEEFFKLLQEKLPELFQKKEDKKTETTPTTTGVQR